MAHNETSPALALGANFFAVFVLIGVYMPFFPVWLESRGMDEAQIGVLLGLAPWARLVVNPVAGGWADRLGSPRRLLLGLAAGVAVSYAALLGAWRFWPMFAGLVALGIAFGPIVPLTDAVAVHHRDRVDYGRVRSVGSLAFIVASLGGGWWFERADDDAIVWSMLAGAVALFFVVLVVLPRQPVRPTVTAESSGGGSRPVRSLLAERGFRRFLMAAGVLMGSHAVLYGFGSLHWQRSGISEGTIGALWSLGVVAEIGLFLSGRALLNRLDPRSLLMLAAAGGVARWIVLGSTTQLPWLVAAQLLHALTFAALHLGAVTFISEHAGAGRTSAAQSLYSGVASGLVFGVGMPAAGWAFKLYGAHTFWAMAGLCVLGCGLALMIPRRDEVPR